MMISFNDAIVWAESQPDSDTKLYALNRLKYERDKAVPKKPKFHKGQYGKKYDYYTCANCGAGVRITYNYCPNCGREIGWDSCRCLTK